MIWQWRNKDIFYEQVELHGDPVVVILCRDREVLKARECEGQLRPCKPVREERFIGCGWDFPPMEEQVEVLLLVQLEHKAEKREVQKLKELRELKTSRAANSALFFFYAKIFSDVGGR